MKQPKRKIWYRKLVRDNIPAVIKRRGSVCETKVLAPGEFDRELRRKILEEGTGVVAAGDRAELTSELADLVAIIRELMRIHRIPAASLEAAVKEGSRKKGGFKKRLFLLWSSDDGYRSNEKPVRLKR